MKRVYEIEIPSLYYENEFVTIHFPSKKDAEYFVNEALCCEKEAGNRSPPTLSTLSTLSTGEQTI